MNKRNQIIDAGKGIAMFLTVYGHSIQNGSGADYLTNGTFFDNLVFRLIYSFHMPLFIALSGYLFAYSIKKYSFIENLKKKTTTIAIPAALWGLLTPLVMWIIEIFLYGTSGKAVDFSMLPANVVFAATTSVWFLWSVFWCSLIVLLINHYLNDSIFAYITVLTFLIIIPDYTFQTHKFMYFYFVIAYFFNKKDMASKIASLRLKARWSINIVLMIIYRIMFHYFDREDYIYTSGISIWKVERWGLTIKRQLLVDGFRYLLGLIGVATIMLLIYNIYTSFNKVKDLKLWKMFCSIGEHSLEIYLINGLLLDKVLAMLGSNTVNYFKFFIATIIVLYLSMVIGKILLSCKTIRKILFGK